MKKFSFYLLSSVIVLSSCTFKLKKNSVSEQSPMADSVMTRMEEAEQPPIIEIKIEKQLLYDNYTLEDEYPYKDTIRRFQWDKIERGLYVIDSIQLGSNNWGVLRNYKNLNGEAPLVKEFHRNEYKRVADKYNVERYQSVPVFSLSDTVAPERYGRDGSPVKIMGEEGSYYKISTINFTGDWFVPKKYVKAIGDTISFGHVVVVDRNNQNITSLEKSDAFWLVRSMNPATTGLKNPPYGQATPLGLFVLQEQKVKMIYLKDGSAELGGFAPWASRFTNGGYIHGVPVNAPATRMIEYSATLGTTPRSHMCVRNATSHAKFIYDWAPPQASFVYVIE